MIGINSYLREIFPRVLLLGGNFSDLILDFLFFYKDFTEGSPMTHAHLLISSKSSPCRVKLWIYIKTIPLICNALPMISFCMIQVSAVFSNKLYIVKSRDFEFHIPSIPSRHHIYILFYCFCCWSSWASKCQLQEQLNK